MILFPASFHCLRQPRFLLEQRQKTRGCLARSDVASPLGGLGLGKFGTNTPHSRGRAFPSARVVGKHSPRTASAAICTLSVIAEADECLLNTSDDTLVWIWHSVASP